MYNKNTSARLLTPKDSGLAFSIAAFTPLLLSVIVSFAILSAFGSDSAAYSNEFWYKLLSYSLSGLGILISLTLFSLAKKRKPFFFLKVNKCRPKYLLIAVLLSLGMLFGLSSLNDLFTELMRLLGYSQAAMSIPNDTVWQYLVWLVVICAMPAFFEEVLFRGVILEGTKGLNWGLTVVLGGLLFSLFHQNPQQTPYQFICGMLFCLLALKSGSLMPTMLLHFLNNFIIISLDFFFPEFVLEGTLNIVLTVAGLAVAAACTVYLLIFDKTPFPEKSTTTEGFWIRAMPGIAICAVMWLSAFFI